MNKTNLFQKKQLNTRISEIIKEVRSEFIKTYQLNGFREINAGWCDLFANEVLVKTKDSQFYEVETYEFMQLSEEEDYGVICLELLKNRTKASAFLNIEIGYHVWITDGNKHFDAECPEGVVIMFDLPFFQRYLIK